MPQKTKAKDALFSRTQAVQIRRVAGTFPDKTHKSVKVPATFKSKLPLKYKDSC